MDENRIFPLNAEAAKVLQDEVRQLIYVFSHDIRNPLVNMKALLGEMNQLLEEGRRDDSKTLAIEMPELISMMDQSVERMSDMIRGANDIYHSMFDELEIENVDLRPLVERVKSRFGKLSGIEVVGGNLPVVRADSLAMTRIVEELLKNALNAMQGKSGKISISVERQGGDDLLIVRDEGIGMSAEEVRHAFDPFYSKSGSEAGMGLSIVKALAGAQGGKAWCESEAGAGAVFYVSIPVSIPEKEG